jgi:hypothetical protein
MFEKQLINGLNGDADLIQKQNAEFLKDHYTSKRVQLINQILNG